MELLNEENSREAREEEQAENLEVVEAITEDEVKRALKKMKSGKAVGPDNLPIEVWKCLGGEGITFLCETLNKICEEEEMPESWRRSTLTPVYKNKGDIMSCGNYRGIKLMRHTMKLFERTIEHRLRSLVNISKEQFRFMEGKSTTDAIFALRQVQEKYRDTHKKLHGVFIDLEKAYNRLPWEELYWCMREKNIPEKYVSIVKDMYKESETMVRCVSGTTEPYKVEVGLHQGSTLSLFLFAIIMDILTDNIRIEAPWSMMFADDVVICCEGKTELEENLERWRDGQEKRGMKVSRVKIEYMCLNGVPGGSVRIQDQRLPEVKEFKYLRSTLQADGGVDAEISRRIQSGWNNWKKMSGVLCDKRIPTRVKGKMHQTVIQPAMLYRLETRPQTRRHRDWRWPR
ncbi:uncharacterized protein LOC134764337 [Penaeus indicus]|uniref:uncharacterized protein LOC134764337 n=1 Tax=Penaeus indicus TaxID=29960 RepID=UPI00300C34C9